MSLRTRRRFLIDLGCASVGSTTLFSSLVHLGAVSAAAQSRSEVGSSLLETNAGVAADEYRALVCILLAGGNDSYNMLVPTEASEYADYAAIRGDLALAQSALLPLGSSGIPGRPFGIHPGMDDVQSLYDQGDLALVSNVGTLVEPVTLGQYQAGTVSLPLGLFSHSDQIAQWQTALPDQRSVTGWGGRVADVLSELNANQQISMNISVAGSNLFQNGTQTVEFSVSPGGGAVSIDGYEGDSVLNQLRTVGIDSLMNDRYKNLFEVAYADKVRSAIDGNKLFEEALAATPPIETEFSQSPLSRSLQMVAQTIAAREQLGMKRQTFFVLLGGWDHHDETLGNQADMLPLVSQALGELFQATQELGVENEVTTFTISDFGRTLTSNGRGSDHAWGGNQIVMGKAVKGGKIYGDYPSLYSGNPLDVGRGRLIPTTSVDEYFAELALWAGVDSSALDMVLPNLDRFYDPSATAPPVGFLL